MESPLFAPEPLVTATWLQSHLHDHNVRIADTRWYMNAIQKGIETYKNGHIPGALYLDVERDLSRATEASGPGRHPLPSAEQFADTLRRAGVGPSTVVVAYDDEGGAIAARLWWLLRYFGHPGGRVLDGGWPAWVAAGNATEQGEGQVRAPLGEPLLLKARAELIADKKFVQKHLGNPRMTLLDARARERYEGKIETIDPRAGHIPGAKSVPYFENTQGRGGFFLPVKELEAHYQPFGALDPHTQVIAYCGSGG